MNPFGYITEKMTKKELPAAYILNWPTALTVV